MVEEHINAAVNAAVEEARREAEQQRMELEQQYEAAAGKRERLPDVDVDRDNFGSVGPLEDIDAQWQKLGCDSEQSCMELLAQYVQGGEGYVGIDVGPIVLEGGNGIFGKGTDFPIMKNAPISVSDTPSEGAVDVFIKLQDRIVELEAQLQAAQEKITSFQEKLSAPRRGRGRG